MFAIVLAGCAVTEPTVQVTALGGAAPSATPDVKHRPGYATYWSGDDLWDACGKTIEGEAPVACRTYIVGVSDGHNASYAHKGLQTVYCLRYGSMTGELAAVVRRYLKAHPERGSRPAASVVLTALTNGYPCQPAD